MAVACFMAAFQSLDDSLRGKSRFLNILHGGSVTGTEVVIAARQKAPSRVWFRRGKTGWTRYVIDKDLLPLEAGGTFADIDGDGDGKGNFAPQVISRHLQPRIQGRRPRWRRPPRYPRQALRRRHPPRGRVAEPRAVNRQEGNADGTTTLCVQ